ncbi:hypothetical protein EWM64_g9260, partial [Hericium alpestre]
MPKHARKRQRVDKAGRDAPVPLGAQVSLTDDASKDDEERRLESMLFGTALVPSAKGKGKEHVIVMDEEEEDALDAEKEFEGLADQDLFFVDDGAPMMPKDVPELDIDIDIPEDDEGSAEGSDESESEDEQNDRNAQSEESDSESDDEETPAQDREKAQPKSRKAPAWVDPDDAFLEVSLTSSNRLRKLR